MDKLPVYSIKVDSDLNSSQAIEFVSLVDYPAIESNWVALSKLKKFSFNKERQMLYGAIMIPDMKIYRNDNQLGEYYVVFSKEEIEKLVRKFQAQGKTVNLNFMHQKDSQIKDVVIQEIWIAGKSDKTKDLGIDVPEGSAIIGAYIGNKEFWDNEVKTGNVMGFSIEGWLDMEIKQKKYKMSKQKFATANTKDGVVITTPDEAMQVGSEVFTTNAEGTEMPLEDGTYELENGQSIVVVAGKISEIMEATEEGELTDEEMAALSKMFSKVLKPLNDKIAELEVRLSQIPATKSATEKKDEKPAAKETALNKINKVKQLINK